MNDKPTDGVFGDGDAELAALVQPTTGVARGSLGTGTALDDTQEYDVEELGAAAAGVAVPAGPAPTIEPAAPSVAPAAVAAHHGAPVASVAADPSPVPPPEAPIRPVAIQPASASTTRAQRSPTSRLAGFAAVALLLVIVGAAALTSGFGTNLGVGQVPVDPGVTAAPTAQPPAEPDGNGANGGNGKGNGNNGGGNGNGKGNGKDKPH